MGAKRSWWQQIKQHRIWSALIIVACAIGIALIVVIVIGYWLNWSWVGVNGGYSKITTTTTTHGITTATEQPLTKTLWDWLQLLVIPLVLAVAALLFNRATSRTEQKIALDKQREDLLQAYLDRMSELLLKEKLRSSEVDAEVRNVARVRTITVLTQLEGRRIGYVFTFLNEAKLMSPTFNDNAESLGGADFHSINWTQANLSQANLSYANLTFANLTYARLDYANLSLTDLSNANLSRANLYHADISNANLYHVDLSNASLGKANLRETNLYDADLSDANLSGAIGTTPEQLAKAKSLKGATMPDGSKHP